MMLEEMNFFHHSYKLRQKKTLSSLTNTNIVALGQVSMYSGNMYIGDLCTNIYVPRKVFIFLFPIKLG